MDTRTSKFEGTLRLSMWAFVGLAVLSLLCGHVLLPLASMGSGIAAGVASQARPVFDGLAVLACGAGLLLVVWLRVQGRHPVPRGRPPEVPPALASFPDTFSPQTDFPVLTTPADTIGGLGAEADEKAWSAALLRRMDWRRFGDLCVAYYRETGKYCTVTPLAGSKGIDIRLFDVLGGPATGIARCWGWGVHRVPSVQLTELKAIMLREKIPRGAWMTNARFGDDIVRFGEANRIAALDCRRVFVMLENLPPESRRHLFELATEGDWSTPTCPVCESKMSLRKGVDAGYWACRKFPVCDSTMKARGR